MGIPGILSSPSQGDHLGPGFNSGRPRAQDTKNPHGSMNHGGFSRWVGLGGLPSECDGTESKEAQEHHSQTRRLRNALGLNL